MSVLILTILSISAVFVCNVDVCVAVWRYKNILENDLLFNTRSTIILEYEGSSFVKWEYPNACEVQNESSPNTVMTCRVSGIYSIKPLVYGTDEDKRQLHISDSFFCFVWYVVEEPPDKTINSTQLESANAKVIRVWAMDPENADPRERNNTALHPSRNSMFISRQFFSMGQDPIVEINDTWTIHFSFNFAEGHWQYLPTSLGIIPKLWISGKPINFQDCFIMSRSWSISTYYEEGQPNDSEFPLILPRGSSLLLTWYTCFFDKAILFTDSGTFITHNGFLKIEEIRVVLVGIPPPASGSFTVTDAAFLETGILFLIEDRIYKRESTRELWQVGEAQNIPASGVQGLQSRTSCSTNNYPSINVEFSKVAVWTANELYLGNDKNKTKFVKKADLALFTKILRLPSNYSVTITAVAYGSRPPELGVLVEACYVCDSTDKRLFLIIYNEETDTWIRSAFLAKLKPHSVPQGPFKMKFILSAWPSLLLWNDELMFYSYKNNSEYGNLHMSGSSNLRLLSGGSRIHQVILDDSWNVVVKMANNVFFYCKAGMDELIRLHSWEEKSTNMIFYLNNNGHLLVLKFNGSKLEPHRYPLDMEVKSSISTVCTYLTFQHSMNKPWYFIDKGEQLEFWALIIYPENMGMNLQTFGYRLDLLQMKTRTQFENAYQICSKNMTIAFHHDRDYINAEKYTELISQTSGIATFEMVPNVPGNTCDLPADRVVHIHVGCNPKRNIRVHRPWGLPCKIMNFTNYTIPGSVLQIPTEQDLVVDYDWEKYGCLFNIYYTQPFLPSLDLYDGDVFLKSVDANFIIWEQHGRTDFSYNASMEEAYCLREAQTWKSMIAMSSNLSKKSIGEAWGPNNYRTCFEVTPGIFGDLGQPYEILNRSGNNFITWSQEQSGIYVFNVKILDPNFSFCDLRTVFTVQTYGVLTSDHSMLIATIETIFTFVVFGILIYSYFRYVKIFNTMSVINPNPDEKDKQQ